MPQSTVKHQRRLTAEEKDRERAIGMVQLGVSYAHVARITTANEDRHFRILSNIFLTDVNCSDWSWTCHQSLHYVVDYDSLVLGPIDHQRDDTDEAKSTSTFVEYISFNVGNIETGNVYSFLMRAGSSYSKMMAGLGYTNVQEREQLRAVFRRWICDGLGRYLWPTADRPYCH